MISKPHYSFFTTPVLLVAAVLQACVGGNTIPKVLSAKTPKTQPSKASSKVSTHALQLEEKHGSAQQSRVRSPKEHKSFSPKASKPFLQHTSSSSGRGRKRASSPSSPVTGQPLPIISEDEVLEDFGGSCADDKWLMQSTADSKARKPYQDPTLPSIESLLKQLQKIDMDDLKACDDCLKAIAKTVSPASAARVQNALGQAHRVLQKTPKGAEDSLAIRRILKIIGTIQADLAHFQRILGEGEEASATSSVCCSGCCEEIPEIDFHRVSKIVRTYPGMAEAVAVGVKVMDQDKASLQSIQDFM